MIRTVIIEDEKLAVDAIEILSKHVQYDLRIIGIASDFDSAVSLLESAKPDLAFLDIQLRNCDAFEVLRKSNYRGMEVIFTTAYSEFAMRAFEENAIGYLLKPVDPEQFAKVVDRAVTVIGSRENAEPNTGVDRILEKFDRSFTVTNSDGTHAIDIRDVVQIEGNGAYSNIRLKNGGTILVSKNIGQFETDLMTSGFVRCHRSHLVNSEHVVRIHRTGGGKLELSTGERVPVSRSKRQDLARLFSKR